MLKQYTLRMPGAVFGGEDSLDKLTNLVAATPTSTLCCCSRPASRATSLTAAMVPIVSQLWWAATWMSASCRT